MKWTLVILILYILPLWILFKNKSNFKRASIYGGMYVVVATVIVICNIYISTLNKIDKTLEFRKTFSNIQNENLKNPKNKIEIVKSNKNENSELKNTSLDETDNYGSIKPKNTIESFSVKKNDKEAIKDFRRNIYKIERKALVPMRNCLPNTKKLNINTKTINKAKKDVKYAKKMCDEVVRDYEELKVPELSSEEDVNQLQYSKTCMQKAYILRGKAMECGQNMLNTKNLKYIKQIRKYLILSDNEIKKFVDTIKSL